VTLRRAVLPEAEEELREALAWYEDQREGLGLEFLGAVEGAMGRAASTPLRWPVWDLDERYRRIVLQRFPYLLFYELRLDCIEFVAVAHVRREPGYWLDRSRAEGSPKNQESP
jgi:plasmid stabilization system protein ParE